MKTKKVKVFDAYSVSDSDEKFYYANVDIFDYHNQIVDKHGMVKSNSQSKLKPIKPLPENLVEKDKYELDDVEQATLKMMKSTTKQAKDLYDSCKRKQSRYQSLLISQITGEYTVYNGDNNCSLSPLGHCIYKFDGNDYTCIFCGEPDERK